jgi:NTP pyrophosphatase (non-canonical NTP hydrolase)
MMVMIEELGEVAREVNHLYGSKKKKKDEKEGNLSEEIGDLLFAIACLATKNNISLDKSFELTMKKKWKRDNYRFKRFNKK